MVRRWYWLVGILVVLANLLGPGFTQQDKPRKESPSLPGIVFVGAPIFDEKTDGGIGVYQGSYHWRDSYVYARSATYHRAERTMGPVRPGKNLYSLIPARPDGKLTRLTHLTTGAVFKPEPSYDGKRILFSMRRDGEDWFNLYEINVDGANLRQLTDGPFNDFAGVYLPDGRIVFCSDRTGYLEEYHEERTECLFVMNGDGTGIEQITFLPGTYFEPTVMRDGRILFNFWDAFHIDVPPYDKHETFLMTVNPDGTEERHLFGNGQNRFFNRERHSGVGLTQPREMPDGRILVQSEMGPSLLDLRAGVQVRDALTPVFPGTTSVQLGGTTHRSHLSPLGTRTTAYPLSDGRFLFSATAPGARDSAIYVCNPDTRAENLVVNISNFAEFDAVPILVERPTPALLPSLKSTSEKALPKQDPPLAKFLVVAGHISDEAERSRAMKKARFFRVIEAEYTGVTTSSHTNLETRILGTVPVFPDGSAYFEAPADTPIFLDPLDAAGNRILMNWPFEKTSVAQGLPYPATQMSYMSARSFETRACYGCHAPQTDAVPNVKAQALKHPPVKVTRESTDLQYRRNEPEAYRRQARLDEVPKYRKWLGSDNPILRTRACEMMMYIEDGVEKEVPSIAKLLGDESVEVRRSAALALTRLATWQEKDMLVDLVNKDKEQDWLTRMYARGALEAVDPRFLFPHSEDGVYKTLVDKPATFFEMHGRGPKNDWSQQVVLEELKQKVPEITALRAAGKLKLTEAIPLLVPWLKKHEYEYHAAEAALALGRIGTREAIDALWTAARSEIAIKKVHISRYLQHGPRPEEYALLKALIIANAKIDLKDLYLLIAMLPNTFMEKPRFEDRMRSESQRVLMPRMLLDRAGIRRRLIEILFAALEGNQQKDDPVYQELVKGINLERPFSEHGRPFPVVKAIGGEEALWLLGCLLIPEVDLPSEPEAPGGKPKTASAKISRQKLENLIIPYLHSKNQRERVDAAVLLSLVGFGPKAALALVEEIAKPYAFPEISSIGKGMPDSNERDKAYMALGLARHVEDVNRLKPFANPKKMFRDIRYGLVRGLGMRAKADAIPLLSLMASSDPLTLIRQQARYALADIQDAYRLAEKPVPEVKLAEPQPLESLYFPPRGLKWADTRFQDLPVAKPASGFEFLDAKNYRNLNMAQATGAKFMMISHVEETRQAFGEISKQPGETAAKKLLAALDSPYPHAHYLAAKALGQRGDKSVIPGLVKKLEPFLKSQDTVGFWWCCEALGNLGAKEALPILAKYAVPDNPPGTYGPPGMPAGYIAARTIARIAADPKHVEVARLLHEDNIWLRAGALRGLAEAKAPGMEAILRQACNEDQPALIRQEARVQLLLRNK